jgi:hypothetical protein
MRSIAHVISRACSAGIESIIDGQPPHMSSRKEVMPSFLQISSCFSWLQLSPSFSNSRRHTASPFPYTSDCKTLRKPLSKSIDFPAAWLTYSSSFLMWLNERMSVRIQNRESKSLSVRDHGLSPQA